MRTSLFHRVCWLFCIGGAIVIVASWVDIVTPQVGWYGWGFAFTGAVAARLRRTPADPVESQEPHQGPDREDTHV